MPLSTGEKLGPYEILSAIGAGGMGEVYKARDTRLDRTVAIKVLPEHIAKRQDLRARFEREARTVASLNHPHICTLYDIGNQNGAGYMVMEYVEGETLAARIEKGALPLDQALKLATQVADALDRAHRAGVTHRDVKPQNIMLTRDGVKVLDFGLAKSGLKPGPAEETLTAAVTTEGTVVGTPQYMAPEQFEGKEADARSDIWAFGAVLYEMVTGQRAFQGKSYASLRGAIFGADPPPMSVKSFTPAWLERLVRRCLAKDADDRYQSMRDAVLDLRTPPGEGTESAAAGPARARLGRSRGRWRYAAAFVLAAMALVYGLWFRRPAVEPQPPPRQFMIRPPAPVADCASCVAISPNGLHIAFVAGEPEKKLWIQDLDQQHPRVVEGSEGAESLFWSPGSDFVGFSAGGELRKAAATGGSATRIAILPFRYSYGATWSMDGRSIVVSSGDPSVLHEVPSAGGAAKLLLSTEMIHLPAGQPPSGQDRRLGYVSNPHFLLARPRRRVLAFALGYAFSTIMIQDLDTGRIETLWQGNKPFYSPSGHLLYTSETTVWARPISLDTLRATGDAFVIAGGGDTPTVAADGTLVYVDVVSKQLAWFDRHGAKLETVGKPARQVTYPALSPDGHSVAMETLENANYDVWVYDLARGARIRLTSDPATDVVPVWSPDGEEVAYSSYRAGNIDIFLRRADASGEERPIAATASNERVSDWSRDGNYILYYLLDPKNGLDLWYLRRDVRGHWTPHPFLQTASDESAPKFSPDGRYVAYLSNESGRNEVYVRAFPDGGRKWAVSLNGASQIRWSRNGREIFFVEAGALLAVPVRTAPDFSADEAKRLFSNAAFTNSSDSAYDVSGDGQKILLPEIAGGQSGERMIHVVQNWLAALRPRK